MILHIRISKKKGISLLGLIILVLFITLAVLYFPKAYNYVINRNIAHLVTANVESVESEIRSEMLSKHPVHIWNNMDELINSLNFLNPVTRERQARNGWDKPGDVVVSFDGISTFRLDGIGRDGSSLRLNIMIQKSS